MSALLDRDAELAALDGALDQALGGEAQLVVVEGSAGVGKSRLLSELRSRAGSARVLTARGSSFEREFAFGVVRQLFEPSPQQWLTGAAGAAESVLGGAGEGADFAALHGLYWLTVNATAERPLVLIVDDLQWADVPSLRFCAYLSRRLEDLPLLLAVGIRTGEEATDPVITAELAVDPGAVLIRPAPLGRQAAMTIARERLGAQVAPAFADACHAATGGNPLFLHELLKTAAAESVQPDASGVRELERLGPRAVSRTVLRRLAHLPAEATAIARAVAVLGDGCSISAAADLAAVPMQDAAAATGALAGAEILRPESPLAFVHPLVRAAIELDIPPGERELAHARAARLLRERGASDEAVAAHLLSGPTTGEPWAADVLVAAGDAALRRGAPDIAVSLLAAALDEPLDEDRKPAVLLRLGATQAQLDGPGGLAALRAGRRVTHEPRLRAELDRMLGRTLLFTSPPEEAIAVVRETAGSLPDELRDARYALEALEIVALHFGADPAPAFALAEQRRHEDLGSGIGARMLKAAIGLARAYAGGSAEESTAFVLAALEGGHLFEADDTLMTAVAETVLAHADRPEALRVFDAHAAVARRKGTFAAALTVHHWQGWTHLRRGELIDAEELLRQAAGEIGIWGSATGIWVAAALCECLVERGDLAGARAQLAGWEAPPRSDPALFLRAAEAMLALEEGDHARALALTEELERDGAHCNNPAWLGWRSLRALALAGLGRRDEAIASVQAELPLARTWGAPGPIARGLRILGTLQDDVELLEEAVDTAAGTTSKLEAAKAYAALGTALRRARRPTDAREPLRQALDQASGCGAERLAERVRGELRAAGARPRREALSGVGALTASEGRVVRLAMEGRTNRDIAQELFVTTKTVEVHLSSAYRKLGVASRRELAGLTPP